MSGERLDDAAVLPTELPEEPVPVWEGTRVDGVEVLGALSPSRAADFRSCPLLYRFRTVDRLPEPPSPAAVRGTVVHRVLEQLFDLPSLSRTPDRADALVQGAWEEVLAAEPASAEMFDDDAPIADWLASCHEVLRRYFSLEDPRLLQPAHREEYVETLLGSRLLLRGIVDRIDVAPDGAIRVVDYKTGRSPGVGYEASALFQMRFYALVIWRTRGVVPAQLRLIYLGNAEMVTYRPDEADLRATERLLVALWEAIQRARETGDWQPSPGRNCDWCAHHALCPAFGGTPPPLPEQRVEARPRDAPSPTRPPPGSSSGR
jgi:putative RecB family exonuclease